LVSIVCLAAGLGGVLLQAQHERQDNCFLRAENDKIRCENIAMQEALRNVICPTCGGPPVADDHFDEQKLRMENARLKEEASHFAFTIAPGPASLDGPAILPRSI
jgi:hypothetical protein